MEQHFTEAKELLAALNQEAILSEWPKRTAEEQQRMAQQILNIDKSYPGGIQEYVKRARILLKNDKDGVSPFTSFTASVPSGEKLSFDDPLFEKLEEEGLVQAHHTCFVLLAGGLGERLGYSSVKLEIPVTSVLLELTFIRLYVDSLLAIEDRIKLTLSKEEREKFYIPLCIMTSIDSDKTIRELLEKNNYYGMSRDHITIVKQENVPALSGLDGTFAIDNKRFELITKPHGHGDVHVLLHQFRVAKKWKDELGKNWVVFLQDTNPLSFKIVLPLLAISARNSYDINTGTVPRKPSEAIGAICTLTNDKTEESITMNIEYNQLDEVLKAKGNKKDVPDLDGYSAFPGSTGIIVFKLDSYCATLEETKGSNPEFVTPKYTDATKTAFRTPARIECMMQGIPIMYKKGAKMGFTMCDRWLCLAPVKNNLIDAVNKYKQGLDAQSLSTSEAGFYYANIQLLKKCGVEIEMPQKDEAEGFAGVEIPLYPKVILLPSFYMTISELKNKIKGKWSISKKSTLIIEGRQTVVKDLTLDGTIWINKSYDKIEEVSKNYVTFIKLSEEPDYLKIRGYRCQISITCFH